MKTILGVLAGLMLLAAAAPAVAHGGFRGGFHGGGFHGGHFQSFHGFRSGRFHHFHGAPFFAFGLGLGLAYPWYGYVYPAYYDDLYPYSYPTGYAQPDYACGTWIWHPETRSYGWLACGATADRNAPTATTQAVAPPAAPPQP